VLDRALDDREPCRARKASGQQPKRDTSVPSPAAGGDEAAGQRRQAPGGEDLARKVQWMAMRAAVRMPPRTGPAARPIRDATYPIAASTMAMSCSGSPADCDAGEHLALAGEPPAATIAEYLRWRRRAGDKGPRPVARGDEVGGPHADEGGRVGLALGELEGECGRSGHAVGENNVPWRSMTVTATGTLSLIDSASARSTICLVSKSMVVWFLSDEIGRSDFSARP
jgi:hypothetical protein